MANSIEHAIRANAGLVAENMMGEEPVDVVDGEMSEADEAV